MRLDAPAERYTVPALKRGLEILRAFTQDRPVLALGPLARDMDLPRATVFRLLRTLESMGFVTREDGGRGYRLGPAVLGLGFEFLAALEVPELARPALEALRDRTGASTHLAIRDGTDIIYVARRAGRSALASNIRVGSRLAAHATSMGRVLLAALGEAELAQLYAGRDLPRFTDQTPVDLEALQSLLRADRARGWVVSRSYFERGVASVAAPVFDASGRVMAAINITVAETAVDTAVLEGPLKDDVVAAAAAISSWLGYRTPGRAPSARRAAG